MGEENFFRLIIANYPQVIAVLFGTLNALSDGMHFGWTAPTIPLLQNENSPIKVTTDDIMKLEVLYMIFGILGLPITVFIADKIGRQKSVLVASAANLIAWILIGVGDRVEYFIIARCLVGCAADVAFVCSPMYIAEVAHEKIRGFLAGIIYAMVMAGILLIYSVAPYVSIRIPPLIGGTIIIIQLIIFPFMPESPYYYLFKNNSEKARKSLRKLRGTHNVENELNEISAAIRRQKLERGKPQDLLLIPSNRRALIIMTILNLVQHMVGFTAILMNLHTILNDAGATYLDSNLSAIVFASVMFVASLLAISIVDKFGRKFLYGVSCMSSGICLFIVGAYYHLKYYFNTDSYAWIPLVFIMLFAASFKFGIGIVPIVMTAELFPARMKALGMTAADGIYVIFASLSLYLYQILYDNYGLHIVFYSFSVSSFTAVILNIFFIPETNGKTLEQIQIMLKK